MEKVCRKPAVKTSSIYLFNLVNSPKQVMHVWDFWKQVLLKRDHEKGNLIFSFAHSHFLWAKLCKAKMPELVTSVFELQEMLTKIPFLVLPFESGNCRKRREKNTKDWIIRMKKTFFKIFKMLSYGKIWKIEDTSYNFEYSNSY